MGAHPAVPGVEVPMQLPRVHIVIPVLVAGVAWLAAEVPVAGQADAGSRVRSAPLRGVATDALTGKELRGVEVAAEHLSSGRVWRTSVDSHGWFVLASLPPGTYSIHARRLGYGPFLDTLVVGDDGAPPATLALTPAPFRLRPMVVSASRRRRIYMEDFERRRALGLGSFVTRQDIERRHPHLVTDLFRELPGVRVVLDRRGEGHLLVRGRCRPTFYVDGVAADSGPSLDMFLRPDDVEGIEVYSTATVPPQYARSACGAVLIWTRVPERVHGRGPWWRGVAVGGVFLVIWGLTR
jgi:hypothetical protein